MVIKSQMEQIETGGIKQPYESGVKFLIKVIGLLSLAIIIQSAYNVAEKTELLKTLYKQHRTEYFWILFTG
jgi:hypothetical protein